MKRLWVFLENSHMQRKMKEILFFAITMLVSALLGGVIWWAALRFLLPGAVWMVCFLGYPAIFMGFFGSAIYLCNHEFA